MKIAITAQTPDLDGQVDPRFGRAACFLIVDTDTEQFEVLDNAPNVNAAGGAGTRSAESVVKAGAQWVLSGDVGPKARNALDADSRFPKMTSSYSSQISPAQYDTRM